MKYDVFSSSTFNKGSRNWTIKKRLIVITISLIVFTGLVLTLSTIYTATNSLEALTNKTLSDKLESDITSLKTNVAQHFGKLNLEAGKLVDSVREPIEGRYDIIDRYADRHDVAATIFKRDGNDFKRILTSIKKKNGQRAVGTMLGTGSAAYKPVMDKKLYIGQAVILGIPYITAYDPIINKRNEIIGINFVGIPMDEVNAIIAESRSGIIWNSVIILLLVILLGTSVAWYFSNAINRNLKRIIARLDSGAAQVNASSEQLSSSSQELADSSSQQAASLQETTSSLEEMSSQITQTAGNSTEAEKAVDDVQKLIEKGSQAMVRMDKAMEKIQQSSSKTSKIIKTIDDIAFQTNLLALNAAVEAARAGEAGKGFAVVAEEVRSLAQRSAEAAQNTSELIQSSQESSEQGASVAAEVSENLKLIEKNASSVGALVVEISAASKEQATGIKQLNSVMSDMDTVVQGNASASEETASSAEELSSQSLELSKIVDEMAALVGSVGNGSSQSGWNEEGVGNHGSRAPINKTNESLTQSYSYAGAMNDESAPGSNYETEVSFEA